MGDDKESERAAKRRREQRLRHCLIGVMLVSFLVPIVICVLLMLQVRQLQENIVQMTGSLDKVIDLLEEKKTESGGGTGRSGQPDQGKGNVLEANAGVQSVSAGQMERKEEQDTTQQETEHNEVEAAHKVYLTFDDGPSVYTEEILDILEEYDVKATFFVLGKEEEADKALLMDIVDRGHTLGMHSYSHSYSTIYNSVSDFSADFKKLQDYLFEVTGVRSQYYRFPGGSSNTVSPVDMKQFAKYLQQQDIRYFDWNVSSGDGGSTQLSVETLVENCTKGITERETSVVLMHDSVNKRTTVEALPMIIEKIKAMEDTVLLPITEDTALVQHISIE